MTPIDVQDRAAVLRLFADASNDFPGAQLAMQQGAEEIDSLRAQLTEAERNLVAAQNQAGDMQLLANEQEQRAILWAADRNHAIERQAQLETQLAEAERAQQALRARIEALPVVMDEKKGRLFYFVADVEKALTGSPSDPGGEKR